MPSHRKSHHMPPMPPMPQQGQQGLLGGPQPPQQQPPSDQGQQGQPPDPSQMLMAIAQQLKISPQQFRNPSDFLTAIMKAAPVPQVMMAVDAMAKKLGIPSPAAAMQQQQQAGPPGGQGGQPMPQGMPQQGGGLLG